MTTSLPTSGGATLTVRYTSLSAALFAFGLVVWGGIVRINNAGMTCPDWPRCRGVWFPALNGSVVYEWIHRLGAPLLALLIIGTVIAAWRARRELPAAWRASWLSAGLLVAQILVGALTIRYANDPPSVAAHLGLGMLTFTSLLIVWYAAGDPHPRPEFEGVASMVVTRMALGAVIATFAAILAAGYMSASNAGLACTGFPICDGWMPAQDLAQRIHVLHRLLAYASFAMVALLAIAAVRYKTTPASASRLAVAALILVIVQVALGAGTVASGLAPVLRSLHQANAAVLFGCLALATYAVFAASSSSATRSGSEGSQQARQADVPRTQTS